MGVDIDVFTTFSPDLVSIVLIAVASYVLAWLLVVEGGPWNIFVRLRWWLKNPGPFKCIKCMMGWVALVLIPIYYLTPWYLGRWLVAWLAVWGVALMLRSYTGVDH